MANTADILVIGSGVAGLSTALQLAARGQRVLLLEKGELASGSTTQAAGLLGQLRSNVEATRMLVDSLNILQELQEKDGTFPFTQSGSVRVAANENRAKEIARSLQVANAAGLEVVPLDASELKSRMPYMRTDDIVSACFCPTDGYLHPPDLAQLYIRTAQRNGVDLRPNTPVEKILVEGGKVVGCIAGGEQYSAPVVVNASGPWSYLVAEQAGAKLPTAAIGHYYFTFGPDPAYPVSPDSPTARDRENLIYSRPTREGGLRVGMYETEPDVYDMELFPADFRMAEMTVSRRHPTIQRLIQAARNRFPFLPDDAPMRLSTGIMSWTPDGDPLCGQMPDIAGLYHCAGFCGHGVMQSAAIGVLMAELILDNTCRYDLSQLEADRFFDLPEFADRTHVKTLCRNIYSTNYSRNEALSA